MWYIYQNGKCASKGFPTKAQAIVEAFEKGFVIQRGRKTMYRPDVEIKEITDVQNG